MKERYPERKLYIVDFLGASSGYGLMMEAHAQDGLEYSGKCFMCRSLCPEDARAVADLVEERFPRLQGKRRSSPSGPPPAATLARELSAWR